jgi:hypothetical protein
MLRQNREIGHFSRRLAEAFLLFAGKGTDI